MESILKYINRDPSQLGIDSRSGQKDRIVRRYHNLKVKICRMKDEIKRKEKNETIKKKVKKICRVSGTARPLDVKEDIKQDLKKDKTFPILKFFGDVLGSIFKF